MNICAAQVKPFKGDIGKNIEVHKKMIELAVSNKARLIIFPELSLTGYEPKLAGELAMYLSDKRLDVFQRMSDDYNIVIAIGLPVIGNSGIQIGMAIFQPGIPRQLYSKQLLHPDEFPYFVNGQDHVIITLDGIKIAPAICYESLLPEHSEQASKNGAAIYFASVAKSSAGVDKAMDLLPEVAKKYSMVVLMANSVGQCDDFQSAGTSSAWNYKGELIGQLDDKSESLLIADTRTEELIESKV